MKDLEVYPPFSCAFNAHLPFSISAEINVHSIAPSNRLESFVSTNFPEGNVCLTLSLWFYGQARQRQRDFKMQESN